MTQPSNLCALPPARLANCTEGRRKQWHVLTTCMALSGSLTFGFWPSLVNLASCCTVWSLSVLVY